MGPLGVSSSFVKHKAKELPGLLTYGVDRLELGRLKKEEMAELENFLQNNPLPLGIHSPLPKPANYRKLVKGPLTPQKRKELRALARETCFTARRLKAAYVIFHLPWYSRKTLSRFLRNHSPAELKELLMEDCLYLQDLQRDIGVPINLETMYLHPQLFPPSWLPEILQQVPRLGACLDVGHIHCSTPDFPGETFLSLAACLLPRVKVVHLYNCRSGIHHRHKPVHPSQDPARGWIDLERIIPAILQANPRCLFILEYTRKHLPSPSQVLEGIHWIRELMAKTNRLGPLGRKKGKL